MSETAQHPFHVLDGEQFMVLTTYRASGEPVPTTVWFAARDGALYVTTSKSAGKVKRIRNNGRVTLTPSDRVGATHGPSVSAVARLAPQEAYPAAEEALTQKYGEQLRAIRAMGRAHATESVYLEITPER